jgi:hypothetical protein
MGYMVATLSVIYFPTPILINPYNVRNYRMARTRELDALSCPIPVFCFAWCAFIQASLSITSDLGSVTVVLKTHLIPNVTSVGCHHQHHHHNYHHHHHNLYCHLNTGSTTENTPKSLSPPTVWISFFIFTVL